MLHTIHSSMRCFNIPQRSSKFAVLDNLVLACWSVCHLFTQIDLRVLQLLCLNSPFTGYRSRIAFFRDFWCFSWRAASICVITVLSSFVYVYAAIVLFIRVHLQHLICIIHLCTIRNTLFYHDTNKSPYAMVYLLIWYYTSRLYYVIPPLKLTHSRKFIITISVRKPMIEKVFVKFIITISVRKPMIEKVFVRSS